MTIPLITTRATVIKWAVITAAVCLLIGAAAAVASYRLGYGHAKAKGDVQATTMQRDAAIHATEALQRGQAKYRAQVAQGNQLAAKLIDQRVVIEQLRQQLRKRNHHVSTYYQPATGGPLVRNRCVITRGWLHDYNAAHGYRDGAAPAASGAESQGTEASTAGAWLQPDELRDSGTSLADVLGHAQDYASWCSGIEAQRDRLIDYYVAPHD